MAWPEKECCKQTRDTILARLQKAERLDAQFLNSRLPGDSALSIEIWGLETAKGDDERDD